MQLMLLTGLKIKEIEKQMHRDDSLSLQLKDKNRIREQRIKKEEKNNEQKQSQNHHILD